jgi:hypothetical protein
MIQRSSMPPIACIYNVLSRKFYQKSQKKSKKNDKISNRVKCNSSNRFRVNYRWFMSLALSDCFVLARSRIRDNSPMIIRLLFDFTERKKELQPEVRIYLRWMPIEIHARSLPTSGGMFLISSDIRHSAQIEFDQSGSNQVCHICSPQC